MSARSQRLSAPLLLTSAGTTLLVVPAGKVALLKTVTLANESGIGATAFLTLNSGSFGTNRLVIQSVGGDASVLLTATFALNPGDIVRGFAAAGAIRTTCFGALLDA